MSDLIRQSLPREFEFYHLGQVEQRPGSEAPPAGAGLLGDDRLGVAFQVRGDWNGWLLLDFDRGLDSSTYSEMGNVIASQFADRLSRAGQGDVLVSPPLLVTADQAARRLGGRPPELTTGYFHVHENTVVRLRLSVFASDSASREGALDA